MEAFNIAFDDAYGEPPPSKDTLQHLDAAYVARAEKDVALQLSNAGVRLAAVLNNALGRQVPPRPPGAVLPAIDPGRHNVFCRKIRTAPQQLKQPRCSCRT